MVSFDWRTRLLIFRYLDFLAQHRHNGSRDQTSSFTPCHLKQPQHGYPSQREEARSRLGVRD
jgi:hypothetical protein